MAENKTVRALYAVATPEERSILDELLARAGLARPNITVLVVRHPDRETRVEVEPYGDVVVLDYGSGFDGSPRTGPEAQEALEAAQSWRERAARLPRDSAIRSQVEEAAYDLEEEARAVARELQHELVEVG